MTGMLGPLRYAVTLRRLRTLADIRDHAEDVGQYHDNEPGVFWVYGTIHGERTEFQMAGERDDPAAVIVQHAPTRFLA